MQSLWQGEAPGVGAVPETTSYSQAYWNQQGPQGYGDYYNYGIQQPQDQENSSAQAQLDPHMQYGSSQHQGMTQSEYQQYYSQYNNYYYQQHTQYPPNQYHNPEMDQHENTLSTNKAISSNSSMHGDPPNIENAHNPEQHQPMKPTSQPSHTTSSTRSTTTTTSPHATRSAHSPHRITSQLDANSQMYLPPLSALDTRIQSFMSSTDPLHTPLIAKFKKIGDKSHSKRPLSSSSDNSLPIEGGFCKVPPFQEFAGLPVGILMMKGTRRSREGIDRRRRIMKNLLFNIFNFGDSLAKRRRVYEDLETKVNTALVVGVIEAKRAFGLLVQIKRVTDMDGIYERGLLASNLLESFRIKALCHLSELSKEFTSTVEELGDEYSVGKTVRGLLLTVDVHNERINLSFKTSRLPGSCDFKLGPISDGSRSRDHSPVRESSPYNTYLLEDPMFFNPGAQETMTRHFRIDECDISFLGVEVEKALAKNSYDRLRDAQNEEWAQETVVKGIGYAKQGEYKKAMQCYQQALDVDPKHRDAFVARGAVYANMNMLEQAVAEFEIALRIDPDDRNAKKYLNVTKDKLKDKEKEKEKEKEKDTQKEKEKEKDNEKEKEGEGGGGGGGGGGGASLKGSAEEKERGGGEVEESKEKEKEGKQTTDKLKSLLEAEERERKRKKKRKKRDREKEPDKEEEDSKAKGKDKKRDKEGKKEKRHKKEKKHKHRHKKRRHEGGGSGSDSVQEVDAHGKVKKQQKEKAKGKDNVISLSPG